MLLNLILNNNYKALAVKFSGDFNLENNDLEDNFINPTLEISLNRRAYNIGLFYNFDNEEGGINFDIYLLILVV